MKSNEIKLIKKNLKQKFLKIKRSRAKERERIHD